MCTTDTFTSTANSTRARTFEELTAWQKAEDLSLAVYHATSRGDFAKDYSLRDQVRRAAVSMMSNIAEGSGRFTKPEIRRLLSISRGSAAELQSQLYLARDLGYLTQHEHRALNALCLDVARMPSAFRASLGGPTTKHEARSTKHEARSTKH